MSKYSEKNGIKVDGLRITFPLLDRYNNVLGFTKRRFLNDDDEDIPKYINSSTSKIFNKSYYFYGTNLLDFEFEEVRITEGPMDVILTNKYGAKNMLASLGTAITDGHVEIIKNYKKTPVFCMDSDEAGMKSVRRAIEKLASENIYSKILLLPSGMDMADLTLALGEGIEEYIKNNSMTYGQFKIQDIVNRYDARVNEIKLNIYPEVIELIKDIPYDLEKRLIKDYVQDRMKINLSDFI